MHLQSHYPSLTLSPCGEVGRGTGGGAVVFLLHRYRKNIFSFVSLFHSFNKFLLSAASCIYVGVLFVSSKLVIRLSVKI